MNATPDFFLCFFLNHNGYSCLEKSKLQQINIPSYYTLWDSRLELSSMKTKQSIRNCNNFHSPPYLCPTYFFPFLKVLFFFAWRYLIFVFGFYFYACLAYRSIFSKYGPSKIIIKGIRFVQFLNLFFIIIFFANAVFSFEGSYYFWPTKFQNMKQIGDPSVC